VTHISGLDIALKLSVLITQEKKMNKNLTIALSLMGSFSLSMAANAEVFKARVQKVSTKQSKVVMLSKKFKDFKAGDMVTIGNDCVLKINKIKKNKALLNTKFCEDKSKLKKRKIVKLNSNISNSTAIATSAQRSRTKYSKQPSTKKNRPNGLRVGLVKTSLVQHYIPKEKQFVSVDSDLRRTDERNTDFGLSIGYANIQVKNIGIITNILFTQYDDVNASNSVRIDASATFAFNRYVHVLGGLNVHKFTKPSNPDLNNTLDAGLGIQAGIGVQINKTLGINLKYVVINNSGRTDLGEPGLRDIGADVRNEGPELSINATF
jgi:hypothetical protein